MVLPRGNLDRVPQLRLIGFIYKNLTIETVFHSVQTPKNNRIFACFNFLHTRISCGMRSSPMSECEKDEKESDLPLPGVP